MSESKELKPKSFRIDDETADKIKEISAKIGGNHQETIAELIKAYEFQASKAILTNKKADIEQFERYINAVTRMFMGSLEDNQNIIDTVRSEFNAQLMSKDTIILELQDKLNLLRLQSEEAVLLSNSYMNENARLNELSSKHEVEYKTRLDNLQDMLSDKDNLNMVLTDTCNELKIKLSDSDKANIIIAELQDKVKEYDSLLLSKDNTNLELREKYTVEIEEIKNKYNKSVENTNAEYKKMLDEIDILRKENLELEKQLLKKPASAAVKKEKVNKKI